MHVGSTGLGEQRSVEGAVRGGDSPSSSRANWLSIEMFAPEWKPLSVCSFGMISHSRFRPTMLSSM